MTAANTTQTKPKKSALGVFTWWKIDPAEIDRQIAGYDTLKLWQSARGISILLCLFTVTVTILMAKVFRPGSVDGFSDAVIWMALGLFMWLGKRWAFLVAMILWTFEKLMLMFTTIAGPGTPVVQIIWWCIYMQAFYLAYKVETRRKELARPPVVPAR